MTREALFHLEDGSPVYRGEVLHVAPEYFNRAGATVHAEFSAEGGDSVTVRTIPEGAVPTIPISALSREPHPDTTDREHLAQALGTALHSITDRDLRMFRAGVLHAKR